MSSVKETCICGASIEVDYGSLAGLQTLLDLFRSNHQHPTQMTRTTQRPPDPRDPQSFGGTR